jgi:hypothetical protein
MASTLLHLKVKFAKIAKSFRIVHQIYALVVKWLSRLPVTEEIAGSNPVERARKIVHRRVNFFLIKFLLLIYLDVLVDVTGFFDLLIKLI